ncbi:uncharacterized protein BXZ73DRAFT_102519 [Epithele typhae]|uniref:uncharacterized protein n=1 Tax=Epithele typhae TaxID=378194 RepID=UPI0020076093|nr:uncharacterized protein BXZ73DRAFT_102519 [Epithele typhae]KAH9928012.1 hypothetical protein BXZ73DRAFT_102519 [Epithele typhae]
MVIVQDHFTPQPRANRAKDKINRKVLPRALLQATRRQARRPVPCKTDMDHPNDLDTDDADGPIQKLSLPGMPGRICSREDYPKLPKQLPCPIPDVLPTVDQKKIAAACPTFAEIPPEHVRRIWPAMGIKMLCMWGRLLVNPPKSTVPRRFTISLKDVALAQLPTHLFAIWGPASVSFLKKSLRYRRIVWLYPAHAVIWAAHCANLPAMRPGALRTMLTTPPSPADEETKTEAVEGSNAYQLPVVPLQLPYPHRDAIEALEAYFYTRRTFPFLERMLGVFDALGPAPPPKEEAARQAWIQNAQAICDAFDSLDHAKLLDVVTRFVGHIDTLLMLARTVRGVAQDMGVLGVVDARPWAAVAAAWRAVRAAMDNRVDYGCLAKTRTDDSWDEHSDPGHLDEPEVPEQAEEMAVDSD